MPIVTPNSFIEDSSVLVASAFLIFRGPIGRMGTPSLWFGASMGLLGASEAVFPLARFPYAPPALACSFATAFGGLRAGLVAAAVTSCAVLVLDRTDLIAALLPMSLALAGAGAARRLARRRTEGAALAAALLGDALGIVLVRPLSGSSGLAAPATLPANAFGLVLLALVLRDARLRELAETRRHDLDEARRVAAESQLSMLRSRVQPHFLFNALNAIAALCALAPDRAAEATVQLGKLMRRSLEIDFGQGLRLDEELGTVRSYLAIEQERFESRLCVEYRIDGYESIVVPAFGLQILVENAVLHGVSRRSGVGRVTIFARATCKGVIVGVADDGPGIGREAWRRDAPHGLGILAMQLRAQFGPAARLHVLPRPGGGTIAAFRVPRVRA